MSTAQILQEVRTLSTPELQLLAVTLRFERLRRVGATASDEELRWLEVINRPLAHAPRFDELAAKWEDDGLNDEEKNELESILTEREAQNVERADAVQHLSELTGVPFVTLWKQLIGEEAELLVPRNCGAPIYSGCRRTISENSSASPMRILPIAFGYFFRAV